MKRTCEQCGKMFEAKRARFCSSQCRMRTSRAGKAAAGAVVTFQPITGAADPSPLVTALTTELDAVGRLDTAKGQLVILLAQRIGSATDTGSATAALSKELARAVDAAMAGVKVANDPLDELKARRDAKRDAG